MGLHQSDVRIPERPVIDGYEFLTLNEVAAALRIDRHKVRKLGIPCFDWGRKSKVYLKADVVGWIEQQRKSRAA
jgi:hypothetical protein